MIYIRAPTLNDTRGKEGFPLVNLAKKAAVLALSVTLAIGSTFTAFAASSPTNGGTTQKKPVTTTQKKPATTTQKKPATTTQKKKPTTPAAVNKDIKVTRKASKFRGTIYQLKKSKTSVLKRLVTKKKTDKIPDTIKYRGVRYKVTVIKSKSLKTSKKLRTLKIGKNIRLIQKNAFYDSKINTVQFISKKVPIRIQKGAFKKSKVKKIFITKKMSKKNYKKFKKKLRNAGYKGKIFRR